MNFSLIAIPTKYAVRKSLNDCVKWLTENGCTPVLSPVTHSIINNESTGKVTLVDSDQEAVNLSDIVVSIGGDGTLLYCSKLVLDKKKPILGINSGRLGFLANIQEKDLEKSFYQIINKKYELDKRHMLTAKDPSGNNHFALNEFLVSKGSSASLITVSVWYDDIFVNRYWTDGLIIATPTGSTAYNMSCGGPIIAPATKVTVITPINPHTLTTRPLVLSSDKSIRVKVESTSQEVLFSKDGEICDINPQLMEVTINRSEFTIDLIKLTGHNYFDTLRTKLMWGRDLRDQFPSYT